MTRRTAIVTGSVLAVVTVSAWVGLGQLPTATLSILPPEARFAAWRSGHEPEVSDYLTYLESRGVNSVVPPEQLFRAGRRWRACGGQEFAIPPAPAWKNIVPTLQLLAQLQRRGLLGTTTVASVFRTPAFNRCEGGSAASRHLGNYALDLDLTPPLDGVSALCRAWRREGAQRSWGLGFYSPTRIHLDTAGFRTWGVDHHAGTSLCAQARQAPPTSL